MGGVGLIDLAQIILDKIIENGGSSKTKVDNKSNKIYTIVKLSDNDNFTIDEYLRIAGITPKQFADGLLVNNYSNYVCKPNLIAIYH